MISGREAVLTCPVCKNPVGTIIKGRHKTFGVYVPTWGPGPCHNPDCPEHVQAPEHTRTHGHS
jgi:hypothetical protein